MTTEISRWPTWARRAFILTLPISGPAYLCVILLWLVAVVVFSIVSGIAEVWNGGHKNG